MRSDWPRLLQRKLSGVFSLLSGSLWREISVKLHFTARLGLTETELVLSFNPHQRQWRLIKTEEMTEQTFHDELINLALSSANLTPLHFGRMTNITFMRRALCLLPSCPLKTMANACLMRQYIANSPANSPGGVMNLNCLSFNFPAVTRQSQLSEKPESNTDQ